MKFVVPRADETANKVVLSEGFTTSIYVLTRYACVFSCFSVHFPMWCPGSGVDLNCIDS